MLQILRVAVAVPVPSYVLETTGEYEHVQKRVDEVLLYVKSCGNCFHNSIFTGQPPVCITFCFSCFQSCTVCDQHINIFQAWVPNNRPCVRCAELNLICCRFKIA